ncbi:uncharacterized protein FOMMEDRAFT_40908, partial [Fomitiporia mediterranea MF3/22]|uniref:uncharacterized protein n=1 Tax=Fomitiporia mediterranea (strain MF3/22) TaxID=694068 RepID=UPI0004407B59
DNTSKKDIFAKSIACLQIFNVLVQTITRKAQSLYITELELMTCGYIVCSLLTYGFWW